ncbi:hypothetical protein ADL22_08455 [Streptomyces sp. NRRL F-4489]|uniref:ATP-grasp domain-containing protein n=1 Tax=Streptomyces sp. NRRL F-4489 TaxID=1609095 RepID=UPI00074697F0|nr:hypothetical protein [Streptomyces sp. NRRL F-4489]KUL49456.1 hypothetical protein ADL22_08455 [Streptomyces sp. NRRL F-4489]
MPRDVIGQLRAWGHRVDVLRPGRSLIRMSELSEAVRTGGHAAWVLKTVSGGPGLTLLEAAATAGLTTVNDIRAIRGVRDKALAAVIGRAGGLPVPMTYAAVRAEEFAALPAAEFPLVVKPADGSSGRAVRLVERPEELVAGGGSRLVGGEPRGAEPGAAGSGGGEPGVAGSGPGPGGGEPAAVDPGSAPAPGPASGMLIAQPYVPNSGTDLKVYSIAGDLYATERSSPLHPGQAVRERQVPLPREVARIVTEVGAVFGLDLYGVDVLLGPDGPVVVDINDFPSFRQVPDAVARVSAAVLRLARDGSDHRVAAPALPFIGHQRWLRPAAEAVGGAL